jgi:tetratricopeptide (TPR) repeat protein/predicted Ser/Thr protein kinase
MNSNQWDQIRSLFAELSEVEEATRSARLRALAGDDPLVHQELVELLAASDSVGDRFERGAASMAGLGESPVLTGKHIGPWQIVREIGHGGMGTVYEAHRVDDQFEKRVALKTVATGRTSEALLRRFRHERQILARLEHKNIATLLDGGVTEDGQPFFVMEYVEGEPIDRWCTAHDTSVRDRVQLFRQVCAAVQFAHEHLVVHRDLKPRNILVTPDGTVKLLDFGIAKLLDPTQSGDPMTQTGALPMTAAYASPEQRQGRVVSTASDVYSLGVVLYELLAGQRPYGREVADLATLEQPPSLPSRATLDRRRQKSLSGDLDSIVLKALRPEPDRRYRSVQLLADDLGHYLSGEPVSARADTLGYRVGKVIRRNKAAVSAAALAVATLIGATVVSLGQARAARLERDRAVRESQRTQQVTAFFQDVLASARPDRLGGDVSVVEAIDSAIARSDTSFGSEPDLRAALKLTLGSTLTNMYLYERARPLLEDAHRLRRTLDGAVPSAEQAEAIFSLGLIEAEIGDAARAESLYRASLDMRRRLNPADSAGHFEGLSNVAEAVLNQGRLGEAAALYDTVAKALDRLRPDNIELRATTRANLGTALSQLGRYVEAEPVLREAVRLFEQANGPDDPTVASALQPLAGTLIFNGTFAEAEQLARRAVAIDQAEFGRTNPATLSALRMVTSAMIESGRCAEALPLVREMLALRGNVMAETDPTLGVALIQLGQCQALAGNLAAAEGTLRDALVVREKTFGPDHWAVAHVRSILGEVLGRRHQDAEAETLLREGYEGLRRELAEGHIRIEEARLRLQTFLAAR